MVYDDKMISSDYVRRNRKLWSAAGFNQLTTGVHNDDRELILAYAELVKNERMLALVDEADSTAIIRFVATRNMSRRAKLEEMEEIDAALEKLDKTNQMLARRARSALHSSKVHRNKAKKAGVLMQAEPANQEHEARLVAHNNIAASYVRYAKALVEHKYPQSGELGDEPEDDTDAD